MIKSLRIRHEIEDERFEPAVDLGDVAKGTAPEFIQDPISFFERTYLTESMKALIVKAIMNILGLRREVVGGKTYEVSSNLILLPSDLGGGKTHTMILLYHIFKLIESKDVEKVRVLDESLADFLSKHWDRIKDISPKVVVIDCKYSDLAPSPVKPIEIAGRKVKTLWGYLGYELGRYELVKEADERETAPYADVLFNILNGSRAVILIDEIGEYYATSGLEPTKISAFLLNLAQAMSKYNVKDVVVVVSLPYEVAKDRVEAKTGMEFVYSPELIRAVNEVLSRPAVEIIKPIGRQDLAEILRKRIFDHTKEELEKFADDFIRGELTKEYPKQVRAVLDERNFWKSVKATYPFHPLFPEILERLAYKLPYLQRTRDAIKIAVQTVLAIKRGVFDGLDEEINLIMPYHIPIFLEEFLDETILRNAPREYKVFQLILKSNVAEPVKLVNLGSIQDVIAKPLKDFEEDDRKLGFKLATVIWIHSLVGLGLPMNMGDFPTTADLIYSVSPTELDVKGVLGILRNVLPQLVVHGDIESDRAKWFFTSIPSIEELIEILKKNVTDEMAKSKLAELLEQGVVSRKRGKGRAPKGYKSESEVFKKNVAVVRAISSIPSDVIDSKDPALIVFADTVSKDKLTELLRGRNNVVALAPYVEDFDEPALLSPEDVKGIRELARFRERTVWEALLEILRYYVATESITESQLQAFVGERVEEEYERLLEDMLKLLKDKVESKREYFYKHVWNLVNRNYRKVYYYRLGALRDVDGLSLESDAPITPIVEGFLEEKELIPPDFRRDDLITIVKDYLGIDPKKDKINVGNLWQFIRTTDKANVPIISYEMFLNAVKDLMRTFDYIVNVKGVLIWKEIFESLEKAKEAKDERIIETVINHLQKLKASWDDVELIWWENVFDDWLNYILKSVPKDKTLKLLDSDGNVWDIEYVLSEMFDPRNTIKSGRLFYEEKKVEILVSIPDKIFEGEEYDCSLEVEFDGDGEIEVKLKPDKGLTVKPTEFRGYSPLKAEFKLFAESSGSHKIVIEVFSGQELLGKKTVRVYVRKKEALPPPPEWEEVKLPGERVEQYKDKEGIKVLKIETTDPLGLRDMIRLVNSKIGDPEVEGEISLDSENSKVDISFKSNNSGILNILQTSIASLKTLGKGKLNVEISINFKTKPELKDLANNIINFKPLVFTLLVKRGLIP